MADVQLSSLGSVIQTAYDGQVPEASQAEAAAGTSTAIRRWTALRIAQSIDAQAAALVHEHLIADITDAGDAAGMNKADLSIALTGTNDSLVMTPARVRDRAGVLDYIDGRAAAGNVTTLTNAHAGSLVAIDQNLTIANSMAPFSSTVLRTLVLWNRAVASRILTMQAGAGGTGTIGGATTYTLPAGGRVQLWAVANTTGDRPQVEVLGDAQFVDLGIGDASTFESGPATRAALGAAGSPLSANLDGAGFAVGGNLANVMTAVTGVLSRATHSGKVLVTSGNLTVPNAAADIGFHATVIAGGAHTITFNALTTAAGAAGQLCSFVVQSTTVVRVTPWITSQALT